MGIQSSLLTDAEREYVDAQRASRKAKYHAMSIAAKKSIRRFATLSIIVKDSVIPARASLRRKTTGISSLACSCGGPKRRTRCAAM